MGEVLFELERVLLTKQSKEEKLMPQEQLLLLACKSKALKDFTIGASVGSGVVWAATGRLSRLIRINLSGGAAAFFGLWRFGKSLHSSVDHILGLEGTRMQRELANIILQKYRDDPARMKLISKHFYSEEVFDDSTSDRPKLRWRYRNVFSDNASYSERTTDTNSPSGNSQQSHAKSPRTIQQSESQSKPSYNVDGSGSKEIGSETKQASVKPEVFHGTVEDPLDFIFGSPTIREEIHHPSNSTSSTKVPTSRSHRRSHRRRRHRHQEEEDPLD